MVAASCRDGGSTVDRGARSHLISNGRGQVVDDGVRVLVSFVMDDEVEFVLDVLAA